MAVPPLKGSDKFVVTAGFTDSTHGKLSCIGCHGGQNVSGKEQAHEGMVPDPSEDAGGVCVECHQKAGKDFATAMHYTQSGQRHGVEVLSHQGVLQEDGPLAQAWEVDCANCHATCGDCHISRPESIKGGLLSQHTFQKSPPERDTCYACHGARTAGEFFGDLGGGADVHYLEQDMTCTDCHKEDNFHGNGQVYQDVSLVDNLPRCAECHQDVVAGQSDVQAHQVHPKDTMSCYVCHATSVNNCANCHVEVRDGNVAAPVESFVAFKIGLNTNRDELHPEKYVTLRHQPTVTDSFQALGDNVLPNFDQVPNWKPTAAHNIQLLTPQNASCQACHNNPALFLTEEDLRPTDSAATRGAVVDLSAIPKL